MSTVIDFGVIRTVREMDDFMLGEYVKYFNQYEGDIDDEVKKRLMKECHREIRRRRRKNISKD